ncbi:hypothetical protein [Williamsia herbipolensis]|uniref:hypothetical protein n=1 Tax=Williamsia herbipolensis TaxID=1603258 RepID=UPI0005F78187|nr:hypothetical protein [Williamsia herbipolensis]
MSPRRTDPTTRTLALVAVAGILGGIVACGTQTSGITAGDRPGSTTASSTARVDARVDDSDCDAAPPTGAVTRAPGGLVFSRGEARARVQRIPAPIAPERRPGESDPDDVSSADGCFSFPRWGNRDVVVPLDSALFVFADSSADGVIVEVSLADLVSRTDLTGQVTVVSDGDVFASATCPVQMSSVNEARTAGRFRCPSAESVQTNPFAPDDSIDSADRLPESPTPVIPGPSAPSPPTTTTPAPAAVLSGWFVLDR